jgi:hypothetical protein
MKSDYPNIPPRKTLWMYFREGLRRSNANRPLSFYLLLAIPVALALGAGVLRESATPSRFAFYLGLLFLFLLAVLVCAVTDFFEIARRHIFENQRVFRSTLGEEDFVRDLGKRVDAEREKHEG